MFDYNFRTLSFGSFRLSSVVVVVIVVADTKVGIQSSIANFASVCLAMFTESMKQQQRKTTRKVSEKIIQPFIIKNNPKA
jgi:hypothetical protein